MIPETPTTVPVVPVPVPAVVPEAPKGNKMVVFLVVGVVLVVILMLAVAVWAILSMKPKTSVQSTVTPTTIPTATMSPSPTVAVTMTETPTATPTQKVIKTISTLEEAMSYALTNSGMQYADVARVRSISALYTPTYKHWSFDFSSLINKHQSEKTFATVFDEVWTTVKVDDKGSVSVDQGSTFKDARDATYYLTPAEAALSSYFDLAKQKLIAAGVTPGTITSAEFSCLGISGTSDFNNQWKVAIVIAGSEGDQQKKAKTVKFMGGVFKEMYDSTLTLY